MSGVGGWPGVIANAQLDPRIRNGALGFTGAMQDLPAYTVGGSNLMVFALPKPTQASAEQPQPKQQ
jgi:alcohol dehydrogenase (cytochrome c)